MPTYDYRCPNGHEFEVVHRMDDPPPASCEVCGAGPLERVFHPVPVFFKGSGFYSTDYGRKQAEGRVERRRRRFEERQRQLGLEAC